MDIAFESCLDLVLCSKAIYSQNKTNTNSKTKCANVLQCDVLYAYCKNDMHDHIMIICNICGKEK